MYHYPPNEGEDKLQQLKNRINSVFGIITLIKGNKRLKNRAEKDKEDIIRLLNEHDNERNLFI